MFAMAPTITVDKEYLNKLSLTMKTDLPTPMFEKNSLSEKRDNK